MPQLVVLDGFTTNPGDLDWTALEALGPLSVYDRTPAALLPDRLRSADIVLTNKVPLRADLIDHLPALRYIGLLSTGYDVVDVEAARARGIVVSNVPAYGATSVAQAAWALLLELTNHVGHYSRTVRAGRWSDAEDFTYWDRDRPLVELAGLTMGVVGYGKIGEAVARRALAFDMNVYAHTRTVPGDAPAEITFVDLQTLLGQSDVVSLHLPLSEDTRHLLDRRRLAQMRPSAFLINTSRGPLIDEAALVDALSSGRLAGAGLDVLATEPPPHDHPLFRLPNCLVTPHQAWATRASRQRLLDTAVDNVRAFIAGTPQNVVT